ncbi:MAG: hypothetical protein FYV88_3630, partial [Bacteroidetes bacterium]|nr:hypothetical protein [Bacteroidota bacterium]
NATYEKEGLKLLEGDNLSCCIA